MRTGTAVIVQPPRGAAKTGKFVKEHYTHNGVWLEIAPTDAAGKRVGDGSTFRARPLSVKLAK